MNKDVAIMWVNALRSGAYPQGRGHLQVLDDVGMEAYCCLGVLCDLHRQRTNAGEWVNGWYHSTGSTGAPVTFNGEVPTADVLEWAGMKEPNPAAPSPDEDDCDSSIAELNDEAGWTFDELADLIEKRWEVM